MKIHQCIALEKGAKSRFEKPFTASHHRLIKDDLLTGLSRNYTPHDENGDQLPPETKRVQVRVADEIETFVSELGEYLDIAATKLASNCVARADVVVDGEVLIEQAPVETLLLLERQLTNLHTYVAKLPVLDPSEEWSLNAAQRCFSTAPKNQIRTKKVPRSHTLAEATKEHPAQVQAFMEDVPVGTWEVIKFSGAITAQDQRLALRRVERLQDAVKAAREEANSTEAVQAQIGRAVTDYLFADLI